MSDNEHKYGSSFLDIDDQGNDPGDLEGISANEEQEGVEVREEGVIAEPLDDNDESSPFRGDAAADNSDDPNRTDIEEIEEYEEEDEERSKKPLIIGGITAVVLVVSVSLYFMLSGDPAPAPVNQAAVVPQQAAPEPSAPEPGRSQGEAPTPQERLQRLEGLIEESVQQQSEAQSRIEDIEEALIRVARQVRSMDDEQAGGNVDESQLERQVETSVRSYSRDVHAQLNTLESAISEMQRSLNELQTSQREQRTQPQTRTNEAANVASARSQVTNRVPEENFHVIAATEGLVFLRRLDLEPDDEGFELDLTPGETLRGYGVVTRVTGSGCIHIGDQRLKPSNGSCS